MVSELCVGNVIGSGALALSDGQHLVFRHVQKLGSRVDEAFDQPRTGDAVHFRTFTSDPLHG